MMTYEKVRTIRQLVQTAGLVYDQMPYIRTLRNEEEYDTSYSAFARMTNAVAAWTEEQSRRLGHPARVAMISGNSPVYVCMMLGVMCGGGISVLLDPQSKEDPLVGCMNKAEADILFHAPEIPVNEEALFTRCPGLREILILDEVDQPGHCGTILSAFDAQQPCNDISEKECAVIIFTSGSTGEEKGVMLSHQNLVNCVFYEVNAIPFLKISVLPMHHAFCLNADILRSLVSGATLCINGGMANLAANLLRFQPRFVNMVPMVAQALYNKMVLVAKAENKPIAEIKHKVIGGNLERFVCGGAHLPEELVDKYRQIGVSLSQGYGMTEAAPTISVPDMTRPDKAHTAGHVVPRCKTRVVDGELQISSPSVMMGYVNAPELTAQVITEDGWLRTGDIGYEDDEGFLHITGRKKNLIILSNGENVSPEQIENLLLDHQLIQECLVYGEGTSIIAEIYPNEKHAALYGISDIPGAIAEIVREVNDGQPTFKKIMKHMIRKAPFRRTGSNKIIRSQRATPEEVLQIDSQSFRQPETPLQQQLFDCVAAVVGHRSFGIETNIFTTGMDSLGCITLLSQLTGSLKLSITLDEIMASNSVELLEALCLRKQTEAAVDYTPRAEYPLSVVQKYFAYTMQGNTTANVPALFHLSSEVDMERLKSAIEALFRIHPILNDRIVMTEEGYVNSRNDSRPVSVPVTRLTREEWEQTLPGLVRPFVYGAEEPLYHIGLYVVEGENYLLFDIAHIISDGVSLGLMLDNMNKLYAGETVEPESYTFYDYVLDEIHRGETSGDTQGIAYFTQLMEGLKIRRSILNRPTPPAVPRSENTAIHADCSRVTPAAVREFCRKHGVSENVFFLTAFNYCISLFSDEEDTISTSIHNGRTDSRWGRISGCLFETYNFRCAFQPDKTVVATLQENARQVMNTMRYQVNCMHADEMFFQFQGDLLNFPKVAGHNAEKLPMQLDSLPFHLIVLAREDRYHCELRFWKDRFDPEQLSHFLTVMDAVLKAMLTADRIRDLYICLDKSFFPENAVMNRYGMPQILGGWGRNTAGETVRILPDGSEDPLAQSGRIIMLEGMTSRSFPDLQLLEEALKDLPGVRQVQAYTCISQKNAIVLGVDIVAEEDISRMTLMTHLKKKKLRSLIPGMIHIIRE